MFGIELDAIKKIELGFCVIVLSLAGYFFWSGTQAKTDSTVAAWTEPHSIGQDGTAKIDPLTNPEDPQRSYQLTVFADRNGRLEFKEYPKKEDGSRAEIRFIADPKNEKAQPPSLWTIIDGEKDQVRRAIMFAVLDFLERPDPRRLSFLERVGLKGENRDMAIKKAQETRNLWVLLDADVAAGNIDRNDYERILAALQAFRSAGSEDLRKNPVKAAAARKVMDITMPYVKKRQDEKLKMIISYTDAVVPLLDEAQKKRAVELAEQIKNPPRQSRGFRSSRGKPATPPV